MNSKPRVLFFCVYEVFSYFDPICKLLQDEFVTLTAIFSREVTGWKERIEREVSLANVIVLWNGNTPEQQHAVLVANSLKIPIIYIEGGLLPGTIQVDRYGVNNRNEIARLPVEFFEQLAIDKDLADEQDEEDREAIRARTDYSVCESLGETAARFVFFPLQVRGDTQTTTACPRYYSNEEAIADVYWSVEKYRENVSKHPYEPMLVLREHPYEEGTGYGDAIRRFSSAVMSNPKAALYGLLAEACVVVTINSTAGVEAMLFGKPIITLGDACYAKKGLVVPVSTTGDFYAALCRAISEPVNKVLRSKFLYYLRNNYLVRSDTESAAAAISVKVRSLLTHLL